MSLVSLTSLSQWGFGTFFDSFFAMVNFIIIMSFVISGVMIVVVIYIIYRAVKANQRAGGMYEVPTVPVKPDRRILRETLPTKCPQCLGPISYEKVDWVGPRQAQCPFCGHVMELQVQETIESQ